MIKKCIEISVVTTSEGADIIADMLSSFTGEGVSIYDSVDVEEVLSSKTNWDYVEEGVQTFSDDVVVKGYLDVENTDTLAQIKDKLAEYKAEDFGIDFGSLDLNTITVRVDNWNEEWRKFYKPIVLDKIAVVPEWIEFSEEDKKVVRLEPGMAFGTGEHASTRLCLSLLEKFDMTSKKVIDVGTGSGILGIACALLGASSVYMTDIDQKAVDVAKLNVEKNNTQKVCKVECTDLIDNVDCDILIGNLTADILLRLLESIKNKMKKGSKLVLSGIISERLDEVITQYEKYGFSVIEVLSEDDWRAVSLKV